MNTKTLLHAFILMFFISCQPTKDDPENLKQVLVAYFEGVASKDLKKLNDVTTSDFILFEDGKVWNNDSLVYGIEQILQKVLSRIYIRLC